MRSGSPWRPSAPITRRAALAGLVLAPVAAAPAGAAREKTGLAARMVRLAPMILPGRGKSRRAIRIEAELLLRQDDDLARSLQTVNDLRPRIMGRLTRTLAEEPALHGTGTAAEVAALKARMTDIANAAIGKPLVEDVLIVSLLVS